MMTNPTCVKMRNFSAAYRRSDQRHLEEEEEPEERPRPVRFVPMEDDREGREEGREPDQRHAEPIDADNVVEPELSPPPLPLDVKQRYVGRAGQRGTRRHLRDRWAD